MTKGGKSGKAGLPLRLTRMALGYMPVKKLARLGVQMGLWQYARRKAVPLATRLSICGVSTCGLPNAPMVS